MGSTSYNDRRADVYALGKILLVMMFGHDASPEFFKRDHRNQTILDEKCVPFINGYHLPTQKWRETTNIFRKGLQVSDELEELLRGCLAVVRTRTDRLKVMCQWLAVRTMLRTSCSWLCTIYVVCDSPCD